MKSPEIMLWVSSNHTLHMPLRDQRLVACLSPMSWGLLHTARCNLCTLAMEEMEKLDLIEDRLRAIEGIGDYPFADMAELCLVLDVVIPPKFKVPDFDKYKGTTCPKNHLKMYCRKMGSYSRDEKLLMHFLQ